MSGKRGIDIEKAAATLKPEGEISRVLKGFEARSQQIDMLRDVLEAYNENTIALVEAGTGTGKSLAYLIPAILWALQNKERTVISTNTINLQEQLLNKDIPLVKKALGANIKAVLVKGMSNYLCLRKLQDAKVEKRLLNDQEAEELDQIEEWSDTTSDGSLSDLSIVPSRNSWERVCAESDTCNSRKCRFFKECHFFSARKEAEDAQLLIVNHCMLFADLNMRGSDDSEGEAGILPEYTKVILDEAHEIEDIATDFFANKVSYLHMLRLIGKIGSDTQGKLTQLKSNLQQFYTKENKDEISPIHTKLQIDLPGLRQDLTHLVHVAFEAFTLFLQAMLRQETPIEYETKLRLLPQYCTHHTWTKDVQERGKEMIASAKRYLQSIHILLKQFGKIDDEKLQERSQGICLDLRALTSRLDESVTTLENFIGKDEDPKKVRWIEARPLKTVIHQQLIEADLDISKLLVDRLFGKFPTTILCSATLTTNKTFDFFRKRLGIVPELLKEKAVTEQIYLSPFDYPKQAQLIIAEDMPSPKDPGYTKACCRAIWESVLASRGNAFILFTSYSMLQQCYDILAPHLESRRFPLLKQGDGSRSSLLDQFKETDRAILFGTDSFWQGVDIAGDALRLVVIAKLPFRVPTEPMIQARTESITLNGGNPFIDYHVPNAIVKFKQGFGRLIRNKRDRGCIVCLDPRLLSKSYGKLFLNSLPPCEQHTIPKGELRGHMEAFYRKTYPLTQRA